jgi:hypothetical protein
MAKKNMWGQVYEPLVDDQRLTPKDILPINRVKQNVIYGKETYVG